MSKERLQEIRALIQAKRFQAARTALQEMPDNPTAQEWLRRLDEIDPSNDDDVLKQARTLIETRQIEPARALLKTIPNNPKAKKWLARLDEMAPASSKPSKKAKQPSKSRSGLRTTLVVLIVIVVGAIAAFMFLQGGEGDSSLATVDFTRYASDDNAFSIEVPAGLIEFENSAFSDSYSMTFATDEEAFGLYNDGSGEMRAGSQTINVRVVQSDTQESPFQVLKEDVEDGVAESEEGSVLTPVQAIELENGSEGATVSVESEGLNGYFLVFYPMPDRAAEITVITSEDEGDSNAAIALHLANSFQQIAEGDVPEVAEDDTDEGFAINVRPTADPAIEVRIDPIYIDNFDELFALPDIRILEIDYWPQDNQIMVTTLNNGIPAMHRILLPTLEDTDRWELPIGPESEPDSFQIDLSKSGDPNAGYVSPIVVTNFSQGMIHMYNFRGDLISSFTTDQSPVGFANSAAEFITVPAGPARTYTRWDVQTGTEIETVTLSPESEIIYSADTGDVFSLYTAFNSDSGGNQYDSAAITIYDPEDGASYQTLDVPPPASESNPGGWQATGLTQNYFVAAAFFMQNDSEGELRIYRRQDDALVSDEPITGFTSVYEPVFLDPIYSVLMLLDGNEVIVLDPDSQEVLYQTTFSEPYDGFTYANRNDNYEIMFYAKEDDPYSPMRPVGYLIGRGSEFRED